MKNISYMEVKKIGFPKDFLWGGSISASQAEGAWDEGQKGPIQLDYALLGNNKQSRKVTFKMKDGSMGECIQLDRIPPDADYAILKDGIYPNHTGADFYHRYKEDISLFAEMGFSTFNTSISWARIFPRGVEGGVNQEGVEFYRSVFEECRKHGIEPVITLYKYDEPVYFEQKYGGWNNRAMIDEYVAFATLCFHEFGNLVKKWITFNEINVLMMVRSLPDMGVTVSERYLQLHHQLVASARAVRAAHKIDPDMKLGVMVAGYCPYPLTSDPKDVLAAYTGFQDEFCYCADTFMRGAYPSFSKRLLKKENVSLQVTPEDAEDLKKGTADFLAFSYYMSLVVTTHHDKDMEIMGGNLTNSVRNPYLEYSEWGWAMDPIGFRYYLHFLYDRYQKPLFVVENGLGAYDKLEADGHIHDDYRIDYHRSHIEAMRAAVEEGVGLFGYTSWGCLDLVSFSTGELSKRYGFIYVDADGKGNGTFKRIRKDSFYWYQKVIASNGEDLE